MEEIEIDGELLNEVTDRIIKKYWNIPDKKKRAVIIDYINQNKPIAKLQKNAHELYSLKY